MRPVTGINVPAAWRPNCSRRVAAAGDHSGKSDVDDFVVILEWDLLEMTGNGGSGNVDPDVDAPELVDDGAQDRRHRGRG